MMEQYKKRVCAVSMCLLGEPCRFDGSAKKASCAAWLDQDLEVVGVCPEIAAGLGIPRDPCEIVDGDGADVLNGKARVIDINGNDKTQDYIRGAEICAELCRKQGVTQAYLKSKSPECGVGRIYDGCFNRTLVPGDGIFATLLKRMGVEVHETDAQ